MSSAPMSLVAALLAHARRRLLPVVALVGRVGDRRRGLEVDAARLAVAVRRRATSTRPASCGESSTSRNGLRPIASWTSWAKSSDESCSRRTACCSRGVTVCCCRWRGCRVGKLIVRSVRIGRKGPSRQGATTLPRGPVSNTRATVFAAPFPSENGRAGACRRRARALSGSACGNFCCPRRARAGRRDGARRRAGRRGASPRRRRR